MHAGAVFAVYGYSAFNLKRLLYGYETQLAVPGHNQLTLSMQSSRTKFLRQEKLELSKIVLDQEQSNQELLGCLLQQ